MPLEEGQAVAETAASEEASFSAGYAKASGVEQAPAPDKSPAAVEQPAAKPVAPVKDEWEGVPPKVRSTLETISGSLGTLQHRLKTTEGRVGALQAAAQTAKSVQKSGGAAPTQEQIQTASTSGEKWNALLESFPDFKDGLEEKFAQVDAALKQHKPFDAEGLRKEIGDVRASFSESARELREFAKLDRKHETWEDTINTPQFSEWVFSNGPTAVEQAQWHMLKNDSPDKAEAFFAVFAQRYPQWWTDKGSHMASSSAKDAIALLDSYEVSTKTVQAKTQQQAKSAQRLEAAITPAGAPATPGQPTLDEEASFAKGYKRVAGR